ncbi:MAG TPA: hypothetical protein VIE15_02245, partial [Acidimicrobiales bacterium]
SADWGQGGPPGSQEPVWTRTSGPWDPAIFTVPPPLRFVMFTDGSCSQGQCTVVGFASLPPTGGEYSPSVPVVATVP